MYAHRVIANVYTEALLIHFRMGRIRIRQLTFDPFLAGLK